MNQYSNSVLSISRFIQCSSMTLNYLYSKVMVKPCTRLTHLIKLAFREKPYIDHIRYINCLKMSTYTDDTNLTHQLEQLGSWDGGWSQQDKRSQALEECKWFIKCLVYCCKGHLRAESYSGILFIKLCAITNCSGYRSRHLIATMFQYNYFFPQKSDCTEQILSTDNMAHIKTYIQPFFFYSSEV